MGFTLNSLHTRDRLEYSAFEVALDAFSNFRKFEKLDDALPTILSKYGLCRVSINMSTNSFFERGI